MILLLISYQGHALPLESKGGLALESPEDSKTVIKVR
jgi:hypothetical protein